MKVLHLFSNWKVTGPAEPVVHLVRALDRQGIEASLAPGRNPSNGQSALEACCRQAGIQTVSKWNLSKHYKEPFSTWREIVSIRKYLQREKIDLVHCHMKNDHYIGAKAAKKNMTGIPVVRSIYEAGAVKRDLRTRLVLSRLTDAVIAFSQESLQANRRIFRVPENRAWKIKGLVDLDRFNPVRIQGNFRRKWNIPENRFVLGIVTRIQARRRFDVMLEAIKLARESLGDFVCLVVGRGTNVETVLKQPAQRLGISDMIIHTGYLHGDDYVKALLSMDAKIFLGGGTDETARAVREAMAMGVPVLVGKIGMLAELVKDGETGLVAEPEPGKVSELICKLARDRELRKSLSKQGRAYALENFSPEKQAQKVSEIYETVLEQGKRSGKA